MMQFITKTGRYHVISHGKGWAYEVTDQATGDNIWFQDDDATQLQSDTSDFENEEAISLYFECLE